MKRNRVNKILSGIVGITLSTFVLLSGCSVNYVSLEEEYPAASEQSSSDAEQHAVDTTAWNLVLVNFAHRIEDDYAVKTKQIPGGQYVDERIYDAVVQMLEDCEAEGYYPGVSSAYRDVQWQTELYNLEVQEQLAFGYPREEAVRRAKMEVAEPGTSEHHTGLALDMIADGNVSLEEYFEDTDVGKWLANNAYKYGFILRFPKGKEDITGVIYEPWHFRYVGKEAAKEITERGICLEEYLGIIDNVE